MTTILAKVYSVEFRNCSYYGNPSYFVAFENIVTGKYHRGYTAPNSASAYGCRNYEGKACEITYHENKAGAIVIDYMSKAPEKKAFFVQVLRDNLQTSKRSAWDKGVAVYASHLLDRMAEYLEHGTELPQNAQSLESLLLRGAKNWKHYAWGGCGFVSNETICKTLCAPAEQKRYDYGAKDPKGAQWLDLEARALTQAYNAIKRAYYTAKGNGQI